MGIDLPPLKLPFYLEQEVVLAAKCPII